MDQRLKYRTLNLSEDNRKKSSGLGLGEEFLEHDTKSMINKFFFFNVKLDFYQN